jgi:hypothetical protein
VASYHFSVQLISRSRGQSALAAAAYRAGARIRDERTGDAHDYSRRRGVVHSEILVPTGAASFLKDREKLWNHVEQLEGRRDAQLAREINLALPHELDTETRRKLLLNFVQEAFVSRGMAADVAIHAPVPEKGDHPHNHHAHILLTLRQATPLGLRRVKTREWNSDEMLRHWRALWSARQNEVLERAGVMARVDHRALVAQREEAVSQRDYVKAVRLDRQPEIHLGRSQRRPIEFTKRMKKPVPERSERNAEIIRRNAAHARSRLEAWQKAYVRQLHRPKKSQKAVPQKSGRSVHDFRFLQEILRSPPRSLSDQLRRIGAGISIWKSILGLRESRYSDFKARYFADALARELIRSAGAGRQRVRLRQRELHAPAVPQCAPAPLQPVPHLLTAASGSPHAGREDA